MRHFSWRDRCLASLDNGLKTLGGHAQGTGRASPEPADTAPEADFDTAYAAGLMRINHTGEVCAQALYQGQALTARDPHLVAHFQQAALEETDHLQWCAERLKALNSHTSYLNPLWYAGSFALGVTAGLFGDRWSLGFLAETERQVARHLENHLEQLPSQDWRSRAIVAQMKQEEEQHAQQALSQGAYELPLWMKLGMTSSAWCMKAITRFV